MNLEFLDIIIKYVGPPFISLIIAAIVYLTNLLRNKIKEKNGALALEVFDNIVKQTVIRLNQTIVKDIKKVQRRKLNKLDVEIIKKEAKNILNKTLTNQIKKDMKSIVKDYDTYTETAIESKVNELKIKNEKSK